MLKPVNSAQRVVVYIAIFMWNTDLVTHECSIRYLVREVGDRIGEQRAARDVDKASNHTNDDSNVPFTWDIL